MDGCNYGDSACCKLIFQHVAVNATRKLDFTPTLGVRGMSYLTCEINQFYCCKLVISLDPEECIKSVYSIGGCWICQL